ncbi:heparinase II/III domain-containing protein [Numidum massiliense]|uniref:heparinase II/III domain-containing protein n=1 Tax=Numidum massiliense TaxID=1522315 RepID=UPI0006D52D4E|nr:heparinase II/III family protein [Numidum massiliense]
MLRKLAPVALTISLLLGTYFTSSTVTLIAAKKEELTNDKTRSTIYTEAKVTAARENVAKYNWAKSLRDGAVEKANKYLAKGYDFLWQAVPAQTLPRSYGVNQQLGSPITGREIDKYGNYPYKADPVNEPWKIVDPSSGYKFPTNDFGAYYESGLDEQGIFRPELADRRLLVNTLYPEKGETWGVDDGFGWVDEEGNRYTFIAYYVHWNLWYGQGTALIHDALRAFRDAYLYTGDVKYARAGSILLDRVADIYPTLDVAQFDKSVYLNSHGGTGLGKAIGSIWETSLVKDLLSAYDAFYPAMDDEQLIAFLREKAAQHQLTNPKDSAQGIRRNIEDGIVRQVFPAVKKAQIFGNNGMHQSALAMAAVVLDTNPETKEWLDFNFQAGTRLTNPYRVTGGNILPTLVNLVDRDGHGNEAAPEYNQLWLQQFLMTADILDDYDRYPVADLYQNVKFRKMFSSMYPLLLSEKYIPSIGDHGKTGAPNINVLKLNEMVKAFEKFGDPIFAQLAYFLNSNRTEGLHGDVFSDHPEAVANGIKAVIDEHGPLNLKSSHLTGYGFTALRDGRGVRDSFGITYPFPQLEVVEQNTDYKFFEDSGTIQLEANDTGAMIQFAIDVPKTDEYEIALLPFKAPSYGIYEIRIDDHLVGEFDFYGERTDDFATIATMTLTEGTHTMTFTGIGKHEAATNYKMGIRNLSLLDREARKERDEMAGKSNTLRDVWTYYGRSSGHGHRDTLNVGLHAFGLDLAPDLGYPEFADANDKHRHQWVNNTVSHNTVVVDKSKQQAQWGGFPHHFSDEEVVKLIDVEAPHVYPQTEQYRRTTAMIKVNESNAYTVDFFRVKGGDDHHFSFHGAEGVVTTDGLNLVEQPTGTYAGPDVAYGERVDSVDGPGYMGSGFHYLANAARDEDPGSRFSADWDVVDTWNVLKKDEDVHLRLTMLGDFDEVALADGVPPQNKPGNPKNLRYLIAHRSGENLDSLFTSVLEPYKGERFIRAITQVPLKVKGKVVSGSEAVAVKVELTNGRVDYIVNSLNPQATYTVDDTFTFKGFFGVYSEKDDRQLHSYLHDGTLLAKKDKPLVRMPYGSLDGKVTNFTKDLSLANEIEVTFDKSALPKQLNLTGAYIYVANDGERNAVYEIKGIKRKKGNRYTLKIGDVTLVRRFVDDEDFAKGYVYDISKGAAFSIPLTKTWSVQK